MTAQNLLVELFVEELPPKALKKLGESFAGTLAELIFASDRSYMLIGRMDGDNRPPAAIMLGEANFAGLTMSNGLTRLATRFLGEPASVEKAKQAIGRELDAEAAEELGLVTFALGSWQMTWITREYDFYELLLPQILRGIGMMCAMVPTNNIALATLQPDRVKNASGLFNLMRNLGGAVGLAVINEVLNDRTDLHISRLQDRVTWGNTMAVETLNNFAQRLQGMGDSTLMAMKQLSQLVHRQAQVMSYGDAFFMLSLFYVALSLLVLFVNKPPSMAAGGGDAH